MNGNKKSFLLIVQILLLVCPFTKVLADGGISPYYKVGTVKGSITDVADNVKQYLQADSFEILGDYNPAKNPQYLVIAFTRTDLKNIAIMKNPRGILAAVLKVGLYAKTADSVVVTMVNPDYLFYSYLRHDISGYEMELNDISMEVKLALKNIGREFLPFGGTDDLTETYLKDYRFMVRDPNFSQPVVLCDFPNYDRGLQIIRNNLAARRGITYPVYELVLEDKHIAIFGVGLWDPQKDEGENAFLGKLGFDSFASMPYEIILIDRQATMLAGKYRFPLFYPYLTMNDFRKIYRTHRGIEEIMKGLTK